MKIKGNHPQPLLIYKEGGELNANTKPDNTDFSHNIALLSGFI